MPPASFNAPATDTPPSVVSVAPAARLTVPEAPPVDAEPPSDERLPTVTGPVENTLAPAASESAPSRRLTDPAETMPLASASEPGVGVAVVPGCAGVADRLPMASSPPTV